MQRELSTESSDRTCAIGTAMKATRGGKHGSRYNFAQLRFATEHGYGAKSLGRSLQPRKYARGPYGPKSVYILSSSPARLLSAALYNVLRFGAPRVQTRRSRAEREILRQERRSTTPQPKHNAKARRAPAEIVIPPRSLPAPPQPPRGLPLLPLPPPRRRLRHALTSHPGGDLWKYQ